MKNELKKIETTIKDIETKMLGEWSEENNAARASELIADINRLKRARNQIEQITTKLERREEKQKEKEK